MAIWLVRLAVDRWRHCHASFGPGRSACAPGEGDDAHPVALITETANGPRIDAVNHAGHAAGAARGMMLADARTLCPQLKAEPSDPAGDLAFLEQLALWAGRWGPWTAIDPPDGLLVDVTQVAHLFGGEARMLGDVAAQFAGWGAAGAGGLAARAAIAPTAGAAWALAHHGPAGAILEASRARSGEGRDALSAPLGDSGERGAGLVVEPGKRAHASGRSGERGLVAGAQTGATPARSADARADRPAVRPASGPAPTSRSGHGVAGVDLGLGDAEDQLMRVLGGLPVAALRLDDDVLLVLRRLGLKRLGDLAGIGRDALQRRFRNRRSPAANPLARLDQLLGRVPEPLLPVVAVAAPLVQRRLMEPIRHRDLLDQVLRDLAADMARELEGRGQGARRLELGLWRVDGEVVVRRLELAAATRDPAHICRLFAARLDDVDAGFGIEMVRLRAAWAEPLGLTQSDLEAAAEEHGTSLAACIDRLTVRLGEQAVRRPVAHASHLPERAQRWQAPLAAGVLAGGVAGRAVTGDLLAPEHTSQKITAYPARPLKMLDRPEKIAVLYATPDGYPRQFSWRGQVHEVVRVEGPERIAPEWWREKGSARLRDYYRIEDAAGRRYWIFRAGLLGDGRGGLPDWFLQGLCA